jgi:membrane protease YdiL (CAAX protease family)
MMDSQLNTKRILIFLALAIGIPWTAALALYLTVGATDLIMAATVANLIFVSTPALANVATRLITREGWGHLWLWPNFRRGWPFYLAAVLLPFLAAVVGGTIFYLVLPGSFDPGLGEVRKLYAAYSVASETNPWMALLFITLQASIRWLLQNGLLSIGEEFGWRAYLLPKLMERFASAQDPAHAGGSNAAGARKAALLIGVIWGVWHWPWVFLSMKYTPGQPILYPLVYLVSTCSLSVLLSWVTLRSGSVWPAAVGHGLLRLYAGLVGFYMLKGPANMLLGPGADGLIGGMGYLVLALVLLFSRKAFAGEQEAHPERAPAVAIANPG